MASVEEEKKKKRKRKQQDARKPSWVVESMVEKKATRLDVASQLRRNNKEGRGRCKLGCPKQEGLSEKI